MRYHDLVRTKSLVRRVKTWNSEAGPYVKTFMRYDQSLRRK